MNKLLLCVSLLVLGMVCPLQGNAAGDWGYTGKTGPEFWHTLSPDYHMCGSGKNQTPVNISHAHDVELPPLALLYTAKGPSATHNGHSVQVDFPAGGTLAAGGKTFALRQVHFHTPSENHLNGKSYPFEAHFVHEDAQGRIAVLAVFYAEGKENPGLAALWKHMPAKKGETRNVPGGFDAQSILPKGRNYIYFNGSLTTPPCSEGVFWYVLEDIPSISGEQVKRFAKAMGHPNNRPLQPVNARVMVR